MAKLEPIAVKVMRFREPVDGPGLNADTSCSAAHDKRPHSRHSIEYWPWMRAFRVEFRAKANAAPDVGFIPEGVVMSWRPLGDVPRPSPQGHPRKG